MRQIITGTDFAPRETNSRVEPVPEILLKPGIVSTPDLERMLALQASLATVSMQDTRATSRVLANRFEIFYLEKAILRDLERIEKATKALHQLEQKMEQSVGDSSRERELWRKFELVCDFIDYSWLSASTSDSEKTTVCANERKNSHKAVETKRDLLNAKNRYIFATANVEHTIASKKIFI